MIKVAHLYNKRTRKAEVKRWGINTPWGGVWVHHVLTNDHQLWHDHEESFLSILIKGQYSEMRKEDGTYKVKRVELFHCNYIPYNVPHLVHSYKPFWTLCFAGVRKQGLSFYRRGKKIPQEKLLYGKH